MSIATAITNAQNKVAACYTSVDTMGGTLPETQNLTNLPTAIESIPTGGGTTYPGLDTDYNNGLATINKGALRDYSISDVTETGCIAKYANIYNNFKIFGNPTINFSTGVVSGFSYDNYIQLPQSVPTYVYCTTMDIIFLLELTDVESMNSILSQPSALRFIGTVNSTYGIYIGSWVNGTTVLQNNKKYWFRVIFDGTTWKGYLLEDDDYVLSSLPDISQWSLEWTTTTDIFRGQQLVIGRNYGQSTQYIRGSDNLSQAVIYVNGVEWWNARGNSAIVNNYAYTNYTAVGSPTIDVSTGLASGFSTGNYIKLPQSFNPSSNSWEMMYKVRYTSYSEHQRLCGALNNTSVAQVVVGTNANKLITWISSNGSSWDIASGNTGSTTLSSGLQYYIKVEFTGTQYIISLSTDNTTWNQEIVVNSSTPVYNNQSSFLVGNAELTNYWHGSIDLSETYIKINNEVWWTAQGKVYQQTQGLYGATTIPSGTSDLNVYYFKDSRNYGLYPNGITPLNGTYGGTINITGFSNYPSYSVSPNWGFAGTPTYNSSDMSYSGFNQDNYIRTNYSFEMSAAQFAKGFTFQMHIKTPSSWGGSNDNNFVFAQDGSWLNYSFFAVLASAQVQFILATGGNALFAIRSNATLLTNTEYWIRVVKPDTRYFSGDTIIQISTDGENWATDTERVSTSSISTDIINGKLKVGEYGGDWYMRGAVYLDGTFIDFNNGDDTTTRVWDMVKETTSTPEPEPTPTRVYNNFTTVGSPIINQSTGVVSGFSSSDYIELPQSFDPQSNTWEWLLKFNMNSHNEWANMLVGGSEYGTEGFECAITEDGKFRMWLSTNNESYDIASEAVGSYTFSTGVDYWVKVIFDGSQYVASYSTDGTNYTPDVTVSSSDTIYGHKKCLGWDNGDHAGVFDGSIDLSESYIKINNNLWWVGYTES